MLLWAVEEMRSAEKGSLDDRLRIRSIAAKSVINKSDISDLISVIPGFYRKQKAGKS